MKCQNVHRSGLHDRQKLRNVFFFVKIANNLFFIVPVTKVSTPVLIFCKNYKRVSGETCYGLGSSRGLKFIYGQQGNMSSLSVLREIIV